jgi:hypothetical protein
MSTLSKLKLGEDFGIKSVQNVVENQNEAPVKKNIFDLKLWQIALLVGIPTALVAFYLFNKKKRNTDNNEKKSMNPEIKITEEKEKVITKNQVEFRLKTHPHITTFYTFIFY